MKVTATNSRSRYYDEYHTELNDIVTSSGRKYVAPERKLGQIVSPFSQSFPPHCPVTDDRFIDRKNDPYSNPQRGQFLPHTTGTSNSDSALRKRSNENKNATQNIGNDIDRTRSYSYQY